ncbi:helix-turn-helix domain-containing protein [Aquibium microcysteis]|uniref:helix-turn-helix domain-containing protein n=1 Tax=Aquibium microcysteis TaxID=675281 RepID=UPI00165D26D4|nr:helix-turn-helix transcriptional regulator [Aquibium microcysteis]
MADTRQPHLIDESVGSRIRARRLNMRLSQEKLADRIGVTFQQVQKYENGANRVSASRLQAIANALDVRPSFFFEEAEKALNSTKSRVEGDDSTGGLIEFLSSAEGLALNLAFGKIGDAKIRRRVVDLVKALGPED